MEIVFIHRPRERVRAIGKTGTYIQCLCRAISSWRKCFNVSKKSYCDGNLVDKNLQKTSG